MGSILFLAANFEHLPQQAQAFFILGMIAIIVAICASPFGNALARLFWFGYHLPEQLARKVGLSQTVDAVHERSKVARFEILAELPLQPKSANNLYKQAETIWKTSTNKGISARAFKVMSNLVRNQVAVLDMT